MAIFVTGALLLLATAGMIVWSAIVDPDRRHRARVRRLRRQPGGIVTVEHERWRSGTPQTVRDSHYAADALVVENLAEFYQIHGGTNIQVIPDPEHEASPRRARRRGRRP